MVRAIAVAKLLSPVTIDRSEVDFELKYLPGEADKKFARAGKPAPGRHDSLEKEWFEIARAWVG